jgi:hypothetical protein
MLNYEVDPRLLEKYVRAEQSWTHFLEKHTLGDSGSTRIASYIVHGIGFLGPLRFAFSPATTYISYSGSNVCSASTSGNDIE